MTQVVIDNPILNSPFREPSRHFRFDDQGITNEIVDGRRSSGYFIPIAQPKKRGKQLQFDTEWTVDRYKESEFINNVRRRVGMWRQGGHVGVSAVTARLLTYRIRGGLLNRRNGHQEKSLSRMRWHSPDFQGIGGSSLRKVS